MIGFLGRRLLTLGLTLWLASLVVFVVLEVLPGDPALLMLGVDARPDTLAALRARMGLDQPAPVRYLAWTGGLLTGDLGTSHTYGVPVAELIRDRLAGDGSARGAGDAGLHGGRPAAGPAGGIEARPPGRLRRHGVQPVGRRGAQFLVRHPAGAVVLDRARLVRSRRLPRLVRRDRPGA